MVASYLIPPLSESPFWNGIRITDPFRWRKAEISSSARFRSLGKASLDQYCAPAMSTECERVFSKAKRMITDERSRLLPATIEANECQKDWLRKQLVPLELYKGSRTKIADIPEIGKDKLEIGNDINYEAVIMNSDDDIERFEPVDDI